jgi:glycosidase
MARLACAMLMSFEGTIGIYQGEELGQTETELTFDELTDPRSASADRSFITFISKILCLRSQLTDTFCLVSMNFCLR